ncbi:T6SS phospholipase effector Tle1-like catalytic domain-containing protein [Sulfuritalea hydrogenivorans]|uniref:T6SS Phospholipase effector Tle1-like catalytic domain-containing protein n=1 Tax=Sulfuritalea hydrogenivorans sk43H TaxID=1223802 RepID=W0SAT1_9PROT|nr:DUF2235 domain-containing protein [Sulfuritalea hydrogenivorans]BAO28304.1 hypothetical protein SUTH_00490 [Sulfuritalea hydrogenivorans sk43H]
MGRNIVLCFDGTNNKYAATNTNVVKLYGMLDRAGGDQLAYYQPGIGTFAPPGVWDKFKKWFITRLDLAIAWLLEEHVSDGYRFLMRYYQDGDRIFIFGFSRGAYTARAVAAMVHKVGLLTQGNEELLPFAWNMFKREQDPKLYNGFRHTFSRKVPIHFIGLWDTVSSVGWMWDQQTLQFTANNPSVEIVRHAVALDERRAYFPQNLWGHDPDLPTDVLQIWFPGVHCDVGGGYAEKEAGLSKIALQWMIEQAEAFGLRFNPKGKDVILPTVDTVDYAAPDPASVQHESLKGLWWIAEFIPKPHRDAAAGWATRWIIHAGRYRHVPENSNIHWSVAERSRQVPSYQPTNLPAAFTEIQR